MYDTLNNFSSTLSHYISLNYRNYELYLKNKSLHEDKVLKSKISLLQSLREFIHVYPGEEDSLFIHISEMGFDHITAGMDINIQNLNIELKELYTKRSDILKKKIPTPLRTLEIERIMRDPFLMLLRKSAGLTEELTPAEYSALLNKEIQTEVTDPQKLISLAIASYTESDGRRCAQGGRRDGGREYIRWCDRTVILYADRRSCSGIYIQSDQYDGFDGWI